MFMYEGTHCLYIGCFQIDKLNNNVAKGMEEIVNW
jgi:hypothetical protein